MRASVFNMVLCVVLSSWRHDLSPHVFAGNLHHGSYIYIHIHMYTYTATHIWCIYRINLCVYIYRYTYT